MTRLREIVGGDERWCFVVPCPLSLLSNRHPDLLAMAATHDSETPRTAARSPVPLSLAPGFSRVLPGRCHENRFNGFSRCVRQTAEAVVDPFIANTRLKPGANERAASALEERGPSADAPLLFFRRQRSAVPPVQVLPLSFGLYPLSFPPASPLCVSLRSLRPFPAVTPPAAAPFPAAPTPDRPPGNPD